MTRFPLQRPERKAIRFERELPLCLVLTLLLSVLLAGANFRLVAGDNQGPVEELLLGPGEEPVTAAVADSSRGFAYFALLTSPAQIVRVRLSDFTRAGDLTLNIGEYNPATAVIDPEAGFAYFGLDSTPGMVVRIRLSDFSRVDVLVLEPGEEHVASSVIDTLNGFAYFGTALGRVVKVRLLDFTRVGSVVAASDRLSTAVIDSGSGFAYFGTFTGSYIPFPEKAAAIVKVRLSDLAVVGNVTLGVGQQFLSSSLIDPSTDQAYFGTGEPGAIVRIRLSDYSRLGVLSPNPGWSSLTSAAFDSDRGYAYFGSSNVVVKVRLKDFNQVGTYWVGGQDLRAATIDLSGGQVYFGTRGVSGIFPTKIVRIPLAVEPELDYSMFPVRNTVTLQPGTSTSVTMTLTGFNYTDPVALSVATMSRYVDIPDVTLDRSTVYPGGCGPSSVVLAISTKLTTPPAYYYVTVTGTAGGLSRSVTIEVSVGLGEPDIVITAEPSRLLIERGSYALSAVWVHSVGGYQGSAVFSSAVSPLVPNGPIVEQGIATFPILLGTMTNVPFNVTTTPATPNGTYNVTLEAVSGLEDDQLVIPLTVYEQSSDGQQGFRIWAERETVQLSHYETETVALGLSSHNGFWGGVTLTASSLPEDLYFPKPTLSPVTVFLYLGASNIALLSLRADESTLSGNYNVTVTGTNGNESDSIHFTVVVDTLIPFELNSANAELTFEAGSSGTSGVLVSSVTGRTCTVQLSADESSLPEGADVRLGSSQVTVSNMSGMSIPISVSSSTAGSFGLMVTGIGGPFTRSVLINIKVVAPQPPGSQPEPPVAPQGTSGLTGSAPIVLAASGLLAAMALLSVYIIRRRRGQFGR